MSKCLFLWNKTKSKTARRGGGNSSPIGGNSKAKGGNPQPIGGNPTQKGGNSLPQSLKDKKTQVQAFRQGEKRQKKNRKTLFNSSLWER